MTRNIRTVRSGSVTAQNMFEVKVERESMAIATMRELIRTLIVNVPWDMAGLASDYALRPARHP